MGAVVGAALGSGGGPGVHQAGRIKEYHRAEPLRDHDLPAESESVHYVGTLTLAQNHECDPQVLVGRTHCCGGHPDGACGYPAGDAMRGFGGTPYRQRRFQNPTRSGPSLIKKYCNLCKKMKNDTM